MNKKQLTALLVVLVFINVASVGTFLVSATARTTELPEYIAVDINSGLAGNVAKPKIAFNSGEYNSIAQLESTPPVGTSVYDWYCDALTDYSGNPNMTLRKVMGNVEIWTQDDMSYPEGDPRNDDPYNTMISDDMINYLALEFNEVIYPTDTEFFGIPLDRWGNNTIFEALGWNPSEWE